MISAFRIRKANRTRNFFIRWKNYQTAPLFQIVINYQNRKRFQTVKKTFLSQIEISYQTEKQFQTVKIIRLAIILRMQKFFSLKLFLKPKKIIRM